MRRAVASLLLLSAAACGSDELRLVNRTEEKATLEFRGPRLELTGGCDQDFRRRFCAEEYEPLGVVEISAADDRVFTIYETVNDEHCTNQIWLRVLSLGDVGPVREPGTLFRLPVIAEIELGAGKIHSAAFPQATIRVDEVGLVDENQGPEPPTCEALGRAPR